MLSMGKMMPEKMIVGIIKTIPDMSIAATWVRVTQEINKPRASDTKIKRREMPKRVARLPATGTFSTNTDKRRMVASLR